jgi:hypothetical protein
VVFRHLTFLFNRFGIVVVVVVVVVAVIAVVVIVIVVVVVVVIVTIRVNHLMLMAIGSRLMLFLCFAFPNGGIDDEAAPLRASTPTTLKRYFINYPHLSDYGQTILCLSFPSRDRATAPRRYEQFYFT